MNPEVWKFLTVVVFFAVVLAVSYWFVLLPDRWTRRPTERGTGELEESELREKARDHGGS